MVKLIFCLHRRPELSREQFQAYWRDKHAPLVASFAPVLGIRRYVQCHTLDEASFAAMTASRASGPRAARHCSRLSNQSSATPS